MSRVLPLCVTFACFHCMCGSTGNKKQQQKNKIGYNIKCAVNSHLTNVAALTQLGTICEQHLVYLHKTKQLTVYFCT